MTKLVVRNWQNDIVGHIEVKHVVEAEIIRALKRVNLINMRHWNKSYALLGNEIYHVPKNSKLFRLDYA